MQQRTLNLSSPGPGQSSSLDCPVCYNKCAAADFYLLLICNHFACRVCLVRYLMIEILESRTDIGEIFMRTSFSCNVIKLFIIQPVPNAPTRCTPAISMRCSATIRPPSANTKTLWCVASSWPILIHGGARRPTAATPS